MRGSEGFSDYVDLGDGEEPLPRSLVVAARQEIVKQDRYRKLKAERRKKSKAAKLARRANH